MMVARLEAFDRLKAFAIFLVLWGHSIQYFLSSNRGEDYVYIVIYSFHMPLFMMISGYFSWNTLQSQFKLFLLKKGHQLLVPCLSWGLLTWFIWSSIFFVTKGVMPSIHDLLDSLQLNYWFLKSLFCCYLLAWLGQHIGLRFNYWIVLTLLLSQLVPFYNVNIMYPAFLTGLLLRRNHGMLPAIKRSAILLCLLFVFLVIGGGKYIWSYSVFRILLGLIGGVAMIGLFTRYFSFKNEFCDFCLINYIGRQTLGIYLLQGVILESFLPLLFHFDYMNRILFDLAIAPLISLCVLLLCISFICLTKKSEIFSFCFWGESRKPII